MGEPAAWAAHETGGRWVVSPLQAAGTWEMSLGHPPYLCPKGQRNQSMVGKQEAAEGLCVAALQDPLTRASAAWREVQSACGPTT